MDKVKPPRDYYRAKSNIVSAFLGFASTQGYVFLCMLFSFSVLYALGVRDISKITDYAGWWFGLVILFVALPHVVFRGIFRYRDVPKGWTLEQARALRNLEDSPAVKNVRGVPIKIGWKKIGKITSIVLGYIVFLNVMIMLISGIKNSTIATILLITLVVSTFVVPIVYIKLFRPNLQVNNEISISKAVIEAKYGTWKKKFVIIISIIVFVWLFFLFAR